MLWRGPNRLLGTLKVDAAGPEPEFQTAEEKSRLVNDSVVLARQRQREHTLANCRTGVERTKETKTCIRLSCLQARRWVQSGGYRRGTKAHPDVDTSGRKCLPIMPEPWGAADPTQPNQGMFAAVISPAGSMDNTDQDGPRPALRETDACSYTILTHYRQWGSCKAGGEHEALPVETI